MRFVENHCHLSDSRLFARAGELILAAEAKGVHRFVLAGVEPSEWQRQKELKKVHGEKLILTFGLHPWQIEKLSDDKILEALDQLDQELGEADGLGETGLDFGKRRDASRFPAQEDAFRKQIRLAVQQHKPITLHIVSAHERAMVILKEEQAARVPLIIHSYSGNSTQLAQYLQFGAYFSYSGSILKPDAHLKTKQALAVTPLGRLLFETDSPDQYWGDGENVPANVTHVYEMGAKLLKLPLNAVLEKVADNFMKIYYSGSAQMAVHKRD